MIRPAIAPRRLLPFGGRDIGGHALDGAAPITPPRRCHTPGAPSLRESCRVGTAPVSGEQVVRTNAVRLQRHSAPSMLFDTGCGRARVKAIPATVTAANVSATLETTVITPAPFSFGATLDPRPLLFLWAGSQLGSLFRL